MRLILFVGIIIVVLFFINRPQKQLETFDNGIAPIVSGILDLPLTQVGRPTKMDTTPVDTDSPFQDKDRGYHAVVPFQHSSISVAPIYEYVPNEIVDLVGNAHEETVDRIRRIALIAERWDDAQQQAQQQLVQPAQQAPVLPANP